MSSGQVISYEEYYPYGATAYSAAASGVDLSLKRYRFTGKERDEETGLDYFGVRYYASWLGRWTSSDPGGFVDGLNLYRYVRNNPVNGIDAEGYQTDPPPNDCPDCPSSAEIGHTHESEDGQIYEYDGSKWNVNGANYSWNGVSGIGLGRGDSIEARYSLQELIRITRVDGDESNRYLYHYGNVGSSVITLTTNQPNKRTYNNVLNLGGASEFFENELANRLLVHYEMGLGSVYNLTEEEMEFANAMGSSILRIADDQFFDIMGEDVRAQAIGNATELETLLNTLKIGESGEYTSLVQALSRASGTLGQFTIQFKGRITKTSENDWSFSGTMTYTDTWDFDSHEGNDQSIRGNSAERDVSLARKYLTGKGFPIRGTVDVIQNSSDNVVDWFRQNNRLLNRRDNGRSDFGKELTKGKSWW